MNSFRYSVGTPDTAPRIALRKTVTIAVAVTGRVANALLFR